MATADAIGQHKAFTTSGALMATHETWRGTGRLHGEDQAQWWADVNRITYVVYSYATPIAWVTSDGTVYKVKAKFSVTTSKHQGQLYWL